MEVTEKINQKFEKLLSSGRTVLQQCGYGGNNFRHPSRVDYLRFRSEVTNLILRVFGENSAHYKEVIKISENSDMNSNSYFFPNVMGILEAAHADFSEEFIFDLKSLIEADVLGDFMDQADELYSKKYFIAAASLAGAVLEDSLRRICDQHGVMIPEKASLEVLNVALAKANVYNKLKQKQLTAWADLRNKADHGKFKEVKDDDVKDMLAWIRKFQDEFLGS